MKQRIPALVLLLLAPGIAEYLLGNLPLGTTQPIAALPLLVALYGGGAVAIREITTRIGGGRPTVVLFALAHGLIEEGLVTQSLFNQRYAVLELTDYGVLPGIGISLPWVLFALTLHAVWSVTVPIVLVDLLFPAGVCPFVDDEMDVIGRCRSFAPHGVHLDGQNHDQRAASAPIEDRTALHPLTSTPARVPAGAEVARREGEQLPHRVHA